MSITQKKLTRVSRAAQLLGKIKTPRKAKAARRNGLKGGRKAEAKAIAAVAAQEAADRAAMEGNK